MSAGKVEPPLQHMKSEDANIFSGYLVHLGRVGYIGRMG